MGDEKKDAQNPYEKTVMSRDVRDRANAVVRELFDADTVKYVAGAPYNKPRKFQNLRTYVRVALPAKGLIADAAFQSAVEQAKASLKLVQDQLDQLGITYSITEGHNEMHDAVDEQGKGYTRYFNVINLAIYPDKQPDGLAAFMQKLEDALVEKRMSDFVKTGDTSYRDIESDIRRHVRDQLRGRSEKHR